MYDIQTNWKELYRKLKIVLTQSASGQRVDSESEGFQLRLDAPTERRLGHYSKLTWNYFALR